MLLLVVIGMLVGMLPPALAESETCERDLSSLAGNDDPGVPAIPQPRLVDRSGQAEDPGKVVITSLRWTWVTDPPDTTRAAMDANVGRLDEVVRTATETGKGPLVALRALDDLFQKEAETGLKTRRLPDMEVSAEALAAAKAFGQSPSELFHRVYEAYEDEHGQIVYKTSGEANTTKTPLALKVRGADGSLRDLDMRVPEERALAEQLVKLAVEEAFHQVAHRARGAPANVREIQLIMPEVRAFAEWLVTRPEEAKGYFPELEARYGKPVSINSLVHQLPEADITAFLASRGLPHGPTEIGGKDARPYPVRALFEIYMRDIHKRS